MNNDISTSRLFINIGLLYTERGLVNDNLQEMLAENEELKAHLDAVETENRGLQAKLAAMQEKEAERLEKEAKAKSRGTSSR